jgi:hypothetical protein
LRTSASFARIVSGVAVGLQSCIIVLGTRSTATIFGSSFSLGTAGIDFFQTDLTVFIGIELIQDMTMATASGAVGFEFIFGHLPDKPRDPTEVGKKGAGFGLVLSKKLAHRMGGDLVVQFEPGT